METDKARITWQAMPSGATGHGDWLPIETAEKRLAELRSLYPEIIHWLEYPTGKE